MSREVKEKPKDKKPETPAYIVTFSDMVTLLLTFFVMLLSMASVEDPEMFYASRDAFVTNVNSYGLGILMGKSMPPNFGHAKNKYAVENFPDNPSFRTIDAQEDQLREIFHKMTESMDAIQSQIVADRADFSVTNVYFKRDETTLNESAKDYLDDFTTNLGQSDSYDKVKMYILGLGRDGGTEKEKWLVSARRAKVVADYIRANISSASNIPIYSWGAGPGGVWVGVDSMISEESQILIAILRD